MLFFRPLVGKRRKDSQVGKRDGSRERKHCVINLWMAQKIQVLVKERKIWPLSDQMTSATETTTPLLTACLGHCAGLLSKRDNDLRINFFRQSFGEGFQRI